MPNQQNASPTILGDMQPSKAIVKLALPATLALLAKAVYNIVDTAYIGMLDSDIALTAVGVTVPLLLIMVSIENIFAAGAAVLAGRQLGAKDDEGASRTVTTIVGLSVAIGIVLCVGGSCFYRTVDAHFRRVGCISSSGQRLCFLDVCGRAGEPSSSKHELRRPGGVVCQDLLHRRDYRRSTERDSGPGFYV